MREIPPVLSVQLYQTVPDVQPSREFLFLGRGRRGDASSGRGVATGRDRDATGPPSGGGIDYA
jgi:hypothetical protein